MTAHQRLGARKYTLRSAHQGLSLNLLSISIGPIALPVLPVLLLLSLWGVSLVAASVARRTSLAHVDAQQQAQSASSVVFHAAIAGGLAARVVYLMANFQSYQSAPLAMLDIRDGGWNMLAWALVGVGWLVVAAVKHPQLRKALFGAGLACAAMALVAWALSVLHTSTSLPAAQLHPLERENESITLTQAARGRPVAVNLWATWCGPCRQEMPTFAAAQRQHPELGILFVNQGESASVVRRYLAAHGLAISDVLLDPSAKLGPLVGSQGLPTTLFFDAKGKQVDAHFGALNAAALESRLRTLANNR
ncbi:MAG: TlpA family protein disulfide reductase [Rhodoferax sp.]|nr:TlpA family protein disulfide reductase [Rhodoferax sp.]